jgi:hypothetical protein
MRLEWPTASTAMIAASFRVSIQEMKAFDERCYFTSLGADSAASLLDVDEFLPEPNY